MATQWNLDEIGQPSSWRAAAAELIGTLLFVFIGTGTVVAALSLADGTLAPAGLAAIALAHGLAIMIMVAATANISGGHINPAVTIALWAIGQIGLGKGILYVGGQLVGAVIASLLLLAIVPAGAPGNLGVHAPGPLVDGAAGGFLAEIILTFALVFVVVATAVFPRGLAAYAPAAIGATVLVDHLVGLPMTGASMNPARSFGPALVAGAWDSHWIYWAGPIVGGVLAALVFTRLFMTRAERQAA